MRKGLAGTIAVGVAALVACSGQQVSNCELVGPPIRATIEDSLRGNVEIGEMAAVQDDAAGPLGGPQSEQRTWFVGAEVRSRGIAIWVTNSPPDGAGGGLFFGVNNLARRVSILGIDVPPQASPDDAGARAVAECLG